MIARRRIELRTLRCACLLLLLLLGVSACSDTGNSANDTLSAQRLLPNLAEYTATNVDTSMDGAFAAMGGAALMGGQVGITAAIAKLEQVLQCFQDRGAIAAKFYSQTETDGGLPHVGAALVINQSRINQEMINCALGGQEEAMNVPKMSIWNHVPMPAPSPMKTTPLAMCMSARIPMSAPYTNSISTIWPTSRNRSSLKTVARALTSAA